MTTTTAPTIRTQLNSALNDYTTENGSRICIPLYIDVPMSERKHLLNLVRTKASEMAVSEVKSRSGISVATSTNQLTNIEAYLGCTLEVLRGLIFSRGGMAADLLLKLQVLTGYEVVSLKDIDNAFKNRSVTVKEYVKAHSYS